MVGQGLGFWGVVGLAFRFQGLGWFRVEGSKPRNPCDPLEGSLPRHPSHSALPRGGRSKADLP